MGIGFSSVSAEPALTIKANPEYVCIYVNSTIYNTGLQGVIDQYKTDVEADGLNVTVYNWSDNDVDNLKLNLTYEVGNYSMKGAVLIGNMPCKYYEPDQDLPFQPIYGKFPCDLYLMDLDGFWDDIDGNMTLDFHDNSTGSMYPEIFVARIDPYMISGANGTQLLVDYFQRNHLYRNGSLTRYNSAMMYIDNPWESVSEEWLGDMLYLYSNVTLINSSLPIPHPTDANDYKAEVKKPYEFIHSFIHSNHSWHGLDWGQAFETFLNSSDIASLDLQALFYNLFCCHAARFTEMDNSASHYLFSSNHTLAVFGCARSGGFQMNKYLYQPLSQGKRLGEAFKYWWSNDILDPVVHTHGPNDTTVKGNCLLGDPFLRIREAPGGGGPPSPPIIPGFFWLYALVGIIGIIFVLRFTKFKRPKLKTSTLN